MLIKKFMLIKILTVMLIKFLAFTIIDFLMLMMPTKFLPPIMLTVYVKFLTFMLH
jgi:hypothetical protein